jgi:hypothetical protein
MKHVAHHVPMSLKLIRIERLKEFAESRGLVGPVLIGQAIGKKANQTSDLLSGKAPFGEKVARSIESFASLPDNWLDSTSSDDSEKGMTWPMPPIKDTGIDIYQALEKVAWAISTSPHRGSDALSGVFASLCKDPENQLYIEMLERLLTEKKDAPQKAASRAG